MKIQFRISNNGWVENSICLDDIQNIPRVWEYILLDDVSFIISYIVYNQDLTMCDIYITKKNIFND